MSIDQERRNSQVLLSRRTVMKAVASASAVALGSSTFPLGAYAESVDRYQEAEYDAATGVYANSERFSNGVLQIPDGRLRNTRYTFTDMGNETIAWGNGWTTAGVKAVGIDVSVWQGAIDWASVKNSVVDYAIIRCGYGSDYSSQDDKQFENNVIGCRQQGIPFGVYLYSYAKNTGNAWSEALHVLRKLNEMGLSASDLAFSVYYDIEDVSQANLGSSQLASIASTFCTALSNAGYRVGVYSSKSWWVNVLTDPAFSQWGRWVAQWNSRCTYTGGHEMWQCANNGDISGISGSVDVNFDMIGLCQHLDEQDKWSRIYGQDQLDTMASISKTGWGNSDVVVIATQEQFWDALTASSLAGLYSCPVLLTARNSLSAQAANEIKRLGATTAYVCGGNIAIEANVDEQIKAVGCSNVIRIYGEDQQGTAREIAKKVCEAANPEMCIIATSWKFQDSLSISPFSYFKKVPIFLCEPGTNKLSNATLESISAGEFERALIVGGPIAVNADVESQLRSIGLIDVARVYGETEYETSQAIANWEIGQGMGADRMALATGDTYYDALAGSALCGLNSSVLLIANNYNKVVINGFIASHAEEISEGYVYGGPIAVSPNVWFNLIKATV